jgi:(S)-ureidoglycine aminohydrolase
MEKATAIVHVGPAQGARFSQYTAELETGGCLGPTPLQRFVYVLEGAAKIGAASLFARSYAYVPAAEELKVSAVAQTRLLVIEKTYQRLEGVTEATLLTQNADELVPQPLLGDASVEVKILLPDSPKFDFAVNMMKFQPGASLPMVESHVMEHGLLMVNGGGIYRLGDCWHPVNVGDFIWMAPFCPQWFGAIGKTAAEYIIYKDWNRRPGA